MLTRSQLVNAQYEVINTLGQKTDSLSAKFAVLKGLVFSSKRKRLEMESGFS